ncbi:MAG TPA: ATP synthase F1 subunit gamma [Polyangiaceae bacterium]
MPSLKAIRKRISSVKSTQKITRAMKMVAGARLNRAQQRISQMRPYAVKAAEMLRSVAAEVVEEAGGDAATPEIHPLLVRRPEEKVLIVLVTSDRGLCGAFNTNISKAAEALWREQTAAGKTVQFATIGRKGREYIARRGGEIVHSFVRGREDITLAYAGGIARWLTQRYRDAAFDAIYLCFSEFKSAITQQPLVDRLLPLADQEKKEDTATTVAYIFEPDKTIVLDRLAPMYLEITIFRALLECQAGFFGAQMTAMDAATRNAKDAIARLTLQYNRARQAAITKELMEIIGGAEALKD